jgi:hypothetical protein
VCRKKHELSSSSGRGRPSAQQLLLTQPPSRPNNDQQTNKQANKTQELKRLDTASQMEGGAKPRVFKLVGPALVAQDADEARATVARRLAAIAAELERAAAAAGALEAKAAEKQRSLMAAQQRMMAAQQQQAGAGAGAGAGSGAKPAAAAAAAT